MEITEIGGLHRRATPSIQKHYVLSNSMGVMKYMENMWV